MTKKYRGIIEPDTPGFHGYVPALKGCHTWGRTVAETRKHLQEAVELYIESMLEHGEKLPDDLPSFEFTTPKKVSKTHSRRRQYA